MGRKSQPYYEAWGSVRGGCGHAHKSAKTAAACAARDARACNRQGGYSDRRVYYVEFPLAPDMRKLVSPEDTN